MFVREDGEEIRYDLKRQQLQRFKRRQWRDAQHQYHFFRDRTLSELEFESDKFKELIEVVKKCNTNCKNISTFITRIAECLLYETYINEGVKFKLEFEYRHNERKPSQPSLKHKLTDYDKHVIQFFKQHQITVTKQIEKWYFGNEARSLRQLMSLMKANITDDQFTQLIGNITYYRDNQWNTLIEEYHYDPKSLVEYLFNYIWQYEALDLSEALEHLIDYYRMGRQMGRYAERYPKYLRSMHDIFNANFKSFKKEYDEQLFDNIKKHELEFIDEKFIICIPQKSKDIIAEGTNLNHCVSSYVDKVLKGESYIFFLRQKKAPDVSLVTLELRAGSLVQAKGAYNRSINDEEKKFLRKFLREKKIETTLQLKEAEV